MGADGPLIAVRFALYATLSGLFGLSAFGLHALRGVAQGRAVAWRRWLAGFALAALALSAVAIALLAAAMAGTAPWPVDLATIAMLLGGSATGTAWIVRMAALGIALAAALAWRGGGRSLAGVAAGGAVALATLAWTGHGAMDEGAAGWVHLVADILHMLAGGAWIGALLGLILMVVRPGDVAHLRATHGALHGFAATGTILVASVVATGLVNGALLVGVAGLPQLFTTLYGQLLLAKVALFGVMLLLAALNRFRLTPAFDRAITLGDTALARGALRRSLMLETGCAVAILALVAWLGTLEPPASLA